MCVLALGMRDLEPAHEVEENRTSVAFEPEDEFLVVVMG